MRAAPATMRAATMRAVPATVCAAPAVRRSVLRAADGAAERRGDPGHAAPWSRLPRQGESAVDSTPVCGSIRTQCVDQTAPGVWIKPHP
eukprot:6592142-Prymnesium_polylepis.1